MLARLVVPFFLLGSLAVPCLGQSTGDSASGSTPPAAPATTNSPTTPPAAKKVWTNDDIPSVKRPPAGKSSQDSKDTPAQTGDPATIDRIRKSLQKLQSQLDDVEKKLQAYKDFENGEAVSTGAREMDKGVNRMPVDQQIIQLQQKKKDLENQMNDLYDEARKKGIDSGQLR
jgi:hypothetical protein